jgi:hypothetical protein
MERAYWAVVPWDDEGLVAAANAQADPDGALLVAGARIDLAGRALRIAGVRLRWATYVSPPAQWAGGLTTADFAALRLAGVGIEWLRRGRHRVVADARGLPKDLSTRLETEKRER